MQRIKVLGISGSIRKKSYNTALLHAVTKLKPENMKVEIFGLEDIPFYNADHDGGVLPEPVRIFKQKIAEVDSLLIASPEYNYSFTGILKNAIDWASRPPSNSPLSKKPYAVMGVSGGISGTMRSQSHFRQVATACNMYGMNNPGIYITMGKNKFNENGDLTDEPSIEHLRKFITAFYEWTIKFL